MRGEWSKVGDSTGLMKRSKSSRKWLKAHEEDEYVRRARSEGYRSRASFKLIEMDDKHHLLGEGMLVVDLGAAPGGWSQVASRRVGASGRVIALDLLPMEPIDGVTVLEGDFTDDEALARLLDEIGSSSVDLVISDMAPNLSGMKAIDQPRAAYVAELAVDLSDRVLKPGGALVVKCFEGEGIHEIRAAFKERFRRIVNFKPKASRDRSREIYLIGCGHIRSPTV